LTAVGCDSGPKVVTISGVAKYQGQPVANLRLNFQPDKGRPSWGDTDANGRFTLEYDEKTKGAVVGNHTVSGTPQDPGGVMDWKPSAAAKAVAAKYGDRVKSPKKVDITGSNDNLEINFD
jgi:hypothetical protein